MAFSFDFGGRTTPDKAEGGKGREIPLRAAVAALVDSAGLLYSELLPALPEFTTPLESYLRVLGHALALSAPTGAATGCAPGEDALKTPSEAALRLLEQLSYTLTDTGRHLFTMATSDASLESFLLPNNQLSIRVKTRLEELSQLVKEVTMEMSSANQRRSSSSQLQMEDAKTFWELLFGDTEEIELSEFYKNISTIIGREPRCPLDRLAAFFACELVDPLNFDRFTTLLETNCVQTADDKLLMGSAPSVSQFLKSQIRIGHLRDAIPQGDSSEPIRALDSTRKRTSSNDPLTSPRAALSPRSDNGDHGVTSALNSQSKVSDSAWLKMKVETWFREVDRIYRFFHGDITSEDAEALLRGRVPGTFLLRYGSTNPSRFCVSFVYSLPLSENRCWKDQVQRRDVILHHELLCTNVQEATSPRQVDDISRRFTCNDASPRRERKGSVNKKKAFAALHQTLKLGAILEDRLRGPADGGFLPAITR